MWLFSLSSFSFPVPAAQMHLQMMWKEVLAPCFPIGMVMSTVWLSLERVQFLSHQTRESFMLSESFKCHLENRSQTVMWLFLSFTSELSSIKSWWWSAVEVVVLSGSSLCSVRFSGLQSSVGGSKFLQWWSPLCSWVLSALQLTFFVIFLFRSEPQWNSGQRF